MASNYPQIPCSKNPLRWHQPWLLNGTVHLREIKWWHLHHESKENLGKFLLAAFTLISTENLTNVSVICMHAQSCPTLCDPWTIAHWAPLYMGFPQQEYRVVCHFPLQGIFPTQGPNPRLLCLLNWQADSLPLSYLKSLSVSYPPGILLVNCAEAFWWTWSYCCCWVLHSGKLHWSDPCSFGEL